MKNSRNNPIFTHREIINTQLFNLPIIALIILTGINWAEVQYIDFF